MQFIIDVRQKAAEFAEQNASTLLTAGGVVGTVATAVLSWRGGYKTATAHRDARMKNLQEYAATQDPTRPLDADTLQELMDESEPLTAMEKIVLAFPSTAPAVVTGGGTVASIIMAHRVSATKAAALAAAYGLAERNLSEYREKVAEKLTGPKKQAIDDELAQDRVNRTEGYNQIVVVEGEVLCFDEPTGRYFRSTMENIKAAVNATNAEVLNHDYANASFFYEEIGLPATSWTEEVGWNRDHPMDVKYSTVMSPDNRPCIAIDFTVLPKLDYVPKHY